MIFFIHASIHTYTQRWSHYAHFPWNKTKQKTTTFICRGNRGCHGGCWVLFQFSDTNMGLIYSSRQTSIQGPMSRACHALGCDRAAWKHCRLRIHRYYTLRLSVATAVAKWMAQDLQKQKAERKEEQGSRWQTWTADPDRKWAMLLSLGVT